MCDADVLEGDVEFVCALEQVGADAVGDGFALGDEFCGVELGDDGFEDFVADGGEHALVVVEAEVLQQHIPVSHVFLVLFCDVPLLCRSHLHHSTASGVCEGLFIPGKS